MKKQIFYIIFTLTFILGSAIMSFAEMQSDNYRIPSSVFSGPGAHTGSTNYQIDSTLGQPSPLMDPSDPPSSSNYNLDPGFWYTVNASGCEGDFEPFDGDVDGSDLAKLVANPGLLDLSTFAAEFGRIDCTIIP